MIPVTIVPKFQVVIPKETREQMGLAPGQKLHAIACEGRIELIPMRTAREMRGFLEGIDSGVERDADRL